ncbi:hypothetical protein TrVFT333_011270 [Trichoderma virens FT-333]|nr:hypothetical protein TrVFT333_011270 [Trichoderma virens FT-333]
MSNPNDYTVGWICALSTENTAATAFLDEKHEQSEDIENSDYNSYTLGRIGKHNVVITVLQNGVYGIASVSSAVKDMLRSFPNLRFALMVGIGGGAPSRSHDIRLGDVVVSTSRGGTGHDMLGHEYEAAIHRALEKYPRMRKKYSRPNQLSDKLYRSGFTHPKNNEASCEVTCDAANLLCRPERTEDEDNPAIHYGPIASANSLIMNSTIRDKFAAEKGILCFEMEAAGIMNQFPCLVIRGICDYADSHRNKEWQGYAAMTAAVYAKDLLSQITHKNVEAEQRIVDVLSQVSSTVNSIKYQLDKKEDLEILDWITPSEYGPQQSDFIHRRQTGTCQWLLNSTEYKTWLTADNQTLFCPGIPGAGKTILTAVVVNDLTTQISDNIDIGLAYIYCNFKRQGKQMFEDLAASLLKQLSRKRSSLPDCSVAAMYSKIFIVIDALDECEASNRSRSGFLSLVFGLRSYAVTNLFATSRHIPDIENQFKGSLKREIIPSDGDMHRFIDANMQHLPTFLSFKFQIQEEIKAEIFRASQGMFLLVELYFEALKYKTSVSEVRSFIRSLHGRKNKDLSEDGLRDVLYQAYGEAMGRIDCQHRDQQRLGRRVIAWITCARRPLMKLELQHALAVKFKDIILDEDNVRDVDTIKSVCAGLVTVDEESGIIRLVHYTTQEYFNQTLNNWFPDAEAEIARVCCTYLSFRNFENGFCQTKQDLDERLLSNPLYDYAAANWGHHARSIAKIPQEVIDFMTCQAKVGASSQVLLEHLVGYEGDDVFTEDIPQFTALHLAAFFGISKALHFLHQDKQSLDSQDFYGMTPLHYAVQNGHEDITQLLLEKGAAVDAIGVIERTALCTAAENGNEGIVRLLLEKGADVEIDDEDGCTALHHAIGSKDITQLLLSRGAEIDATDLSGSTPLILAAGDGQEDTVRLLLQYGAKVDAKDDSGRTSLIHAIIKNHERIVRLLVDEGAQLEERDARGRTPLFVAAKSGHRDIVRLLLAKNARLEERDAHGRTPLFVAAESAHKDIVRLLLSEGADVGARDNYGRIPLIHPDWGFTYQYHPVSIRNGQNS